MANQSAVQATTALPGTAAETAIVNTPLGTFNNPGGQGNLVGGTAVVTTGTGATAVVLRVRQGVGTGGTLVGTFTVPQAASTVASIPYDFLDSSALALNSGAAGLQYTLTISQTGGTGAGTVTAVLYSQPSTPAS
jgi:hypothetical protein